MGKIYKNTKTGAVVVEIKTGLIVKAGSFVKPLKASASERISERREGVIDADSKTTKDLYFGSSSAAASFLCGCQMNGVKFFANRDWTIIEVSEEETMAEINLDDFALSKTEEKKSELEQPKESKPAKATKPAKESKESKAETISKEEQKQRAELVGKVLNFCKDFDYKPDPRSLDSLRYVDGADLIGNILELEGRDAETVKDARAKLCSAEWKGIEAEIKALTTRNERINKRLFIKYGEAGTGKTTDALKQYPTARKLAGSASFDPSELFTRFDPTSKKYVLTELAEAMESGEKIIIDEANLYPVEVLQRLQAVLDNSPSVVDNGIEINVKDGFGVIITMNLETNLGTRPLPSPLISRAVTIEKYSLNAKKAGNAAQFIW